MRKFSIFVIFLVLLFSPTTVFASTLSLDPANGPFNRGCGFSINVLLDTQGTQTDGTDAILIYDSSRFSGQSITNGSIYPDFPGNNINDTLGRITISGLASVATPFTGKGILATVQFRVKETAPTGATQISFDFDPNDKAKTTDSNVVERGTVVDTLSSVLNGSYIVGTGSCSAQASPAPTTAPGTPGSSVVPPPGTVVTQFPGGQGTVVVATPPAQPKTLDQFVDKTGQGPGTPELTFTLAIIGSILTVLGILGLALL